MSAGGCEDDTIIHREKCVIMKEESCEAMIEATAAESSCSQHSRSTSIFRRQFKRSNYFFTFK